MKVFIISGKARHGKDKVASIIQHIYEEKGMKSCLCPYAKYLKHYVQDYFGWDGNTDTKPRDLLNHLGTDIIRNKLDKKDFFVNRTIEDIEILSNFFDVIIMPDARFPNEIDKVKEKYPEAIAIRVTRINFQTDLTEAQQLFATETALDNYDKYDYHVINDDIDTLEQNVRDIIEEGSKNE